MIRNIVVVLVLFCAASMGYAQTGTAMSGDDWKKKKEPPRQEQHQKQDQDQHQKIDPPNQRWVIFLI
jgi:hypothetical protein